MIQKYHEQAEILWERVRRIGKYGKICDLLMNNQPPKIEFRATFDWDSDVRSLKEKENCMKEECIFCGTTEDLVFAPDPYRQEIHGDDTPVWECKDCRYQNAMDV